MDWSLGPAEIVGAFTAAVYGAFKAKAKLNGGSIKERLVRLETKVDMIMDSMNLKPKE